MSKPTIISEPYQSAAGKPVEGDNSYRGLRIHSLAGLHKHVASLLTESLPKGASIFELASGTGAMCARLIDMGFQLSTSDYVPDNFQLHGEVPFHQVDLNSDYSSKMEDKFDCVLGIEIIEHLENPREVIRNALSIINPGGFIVLTTPNISSPVSKALFIREGTFHWFNDADHQTQGHIRPICRWELHKIMDEVGAEICHSGSYGDPFTHLEQWPKMRWLAKFIAAISSEDASLQGEVLTLVARKKTEAE